MQKASCCCMLKEKVFRVQKFSIRWDAVRAVIQPFVRWQLLNILTKTSWHCLSFREIKWSFISFVFFPSLFTPALIDASQKMRHWSPICVRVGGWVRESVRFVGFFFFVVLCDFSHALGNTGNHSLDILLYCYPHTWQRWYTAKSNSSGSVADSALCHIPTRKMKVESCSYRNPSRGYLITKTRLDLDFF